MLAQFQDVIINLMEFNSNTTKKQLAIEQTDNKSDHLPHNISKQSSYQYYLSLKSLLIKYQQAYEANTPLISDEQYDLMYRELKTLEEQYDYSSNVSLDSPTNVIGYKQAEKKYVTHLVPMLSLDHELGAQGLQFFMDKINRFLSTDVEYPLIAQPKIDGVSVALRYKDGILHTAALRGDGIEGEDITTNILSLNIPIKFDIFGLLDFEIRGELYMPLSTYNQFFKNEFASARHAVAGSVRLLDVAEFTKRKIEFLVHGFAGLTELSGKYTLDEIMKEISKNIYEKKFQLVEQQLCLNNNHAMEIFEQWAKKRESLDYLMDGVVFKLNDLTLWQKLQYSAKSPRYAFALKFEGNKGMGKVMQVHWLVGRTGVITPVLEIEPTMIDGTQISKVTLHNASEFLRFNPQLNDSAIIERAFDVIPYLIDIIDFDIHKPEPVLPSHCPCCGSVLRFDDKFLICDNGWECKEQAIDRIFHVLSRDAFDIDGLGLQKLNFLYDMEIVRKPADVFTLEAKCLSRNIVLSDQEGWGKKSVEKLLLNIEQKRSILFSRFLYAIGINGVGKSLAKKISQYCSNWQEFKAWVKTDMKDLDGVGEKIYQNVMEFIDTDHENAGKTNWLEDLLNQVIIMPDKQLSQDAIHIVLTGKFSVSRQAMKQALSSYAFLIVGDSLTSKTKYLIYGEDAGSKLKKAKEAGIECVTEQEWNALLANF